MTDTRIAFIGTGNMNGAILEGALKAGVSKDSVVVTTRSVESAEAWRKNQGIEALSQQEDERANLQAVSDADVVLMGVKPHMMADVLGELAPQLKPDAVVVSIAAAVSVEQLEAAVAKGQPVIRTMPNTPLQYGSGVVGLVRGTNITDEHVGLVSSIFEGAGKVFEIPESHIDALTAVSGSGPAYAFFLAEAMAQGGVELGLDPEFARELAAATVAGAGAMLAQDEREPAQLRRAVTSPGGTTEAAINTMGREGFSEAVVAGQKACAERAAEMAG